MSTEVQQNSLWAFRNLDQMDPALRNDRIAEPTEEYTVPASAGLVGMICQKLAIDPTKGNEGDEVWRHLRGRPVSALYAFYVAALEPAGNDDPREVYRLIREFSGKYEDALEGQS